MHLQAVELTVDFAGRPALERVSLDLPQGTWLGLWGGPGTGKTTLLKALAGLVRPTAGTVLWDGLDATRLSAEERRERQAAFGMVFQTDALFDDLSVLQNVVLPLHRRGIPDPEAGHRAREAIAQVGLADAASLRPDALSGGMRKRAGIARALVARPAVLLADDPLAGLDPATALQVARLLLEVSRGRTLVVAQPDPDPLFGFERWVELA